MPDAPKEKVTHQLYLDAKNELNELMTRKKLVDRNLAGLENSIYAFEGSYLEDTQHGGNIIRGFDGYINTKADKSRVKYSESDRLFSMSSTTFTKALQIKDNPDQESSQDESRRSSSTSKRPTLKTSSTTSNIAPPPPTIPAQSSSSSSASRRLLKQQKSSSSSSSNNNNHPKGSERPPKKIRLSSTADGDEDLDV
ncbi:MAG: histone acetyltransferase subunit NuA4-domain-containing protein [Linnemannia gamsii]|nr:MAG: histone acetyltransferase subunit NuA4-domain-containing protein [Linnemannia gamsii]